MSQAFQQIDLSTVISKAKVAFERVQNRDKAARTVLATLYHQEGKVINHRLVNKLNLILPEFKFGLDTRHGWYELEISGLGFDTFGVNLGYKSQTSVIDNAKINEGFKLYILNDEQIAKYREEVETIGQRAQRFNDALVELKASYDGLGEFRYAFSDNHLPSIKDANGRWI